jgi:hypothetical protein
MPAFFLLRRRFILVGAQLTLIGIFAGFDSPAAGINIGSASDPISIIDLHYSPRMASHRAQHYFLVFV